MVNKTKEPVNCYVDVTQLVHWDGKLTGIPRVMYELSIRFSNEGNVRFVSWVKELKSYCEIDFPRTLAENHIHYITKDQEFMPKPVNSETRTIPATTNTTNSKKAIKKALNKAIDSTKYIRGGAPARIRSQISKAKARSYKKITLSTNDSVFIPWGEWWDKNFLSMIVRAGKAGAKISTIIHDVGPMVVPHLSGNSASLADYCSTVVPVSDMVFVNSQYTKKTLVDWLKRHQLNVPPISVFKIGDNFERKESKKPDNKVFAESGLNGGDFILTVGTVELKKNHIFYYYVYKLAAERGIELPKLVIAGRRGYGTETNIDLMMKDPALKDKFVFQFNTSDEELAWLYENTKFSLFASFYEGWGMPLAESLFHGTPVISARSTSLVEIGEGIIDRFTQASTDECLAAVMKMLDQDYLKSKRQAVSTYNPSLWQDAYNTITRTMIEEGIL